MKCPVCKKTAASCFCRPISMDSTGKVGEKYISALAFYGRPGSEDERDIAVRKIINHLKKSSDRGCVRFISAELSRLILRKLLAGDEETGEWVICAPPRTKSRIRQFGFDQSRQLALEISRYTGIPFENCFDNTGNEMQKTLNVIERRRNAEVSYDLQRGCRAGGKKYIIVDDIITTGATVNACSKLLYSGGAQTVYPVCVARTKPKKRKLRRRISEKLWFR